MLVVLSVLQWFINIAICLLSMRVFCWFALVLCAFVDCLVHLEPKSTTRDASPDEGYHVDAWAEQVVQGLDNSWEPKDVGEARSAKPPHKLLKLNESAQIGQWAGNRKCSSARRRC